jgi:Kdo2-lipid IVA lauroyltransferase/acyltransferase
MQQLESGCCSPVIENRLLKPRAPVEYRRHPISTLRHISRDPRIARLVRANKSDGRKPAEQANPQNRRGQSRRQEVSRRKRRFRIHCAVSVTNAAILHTPASVHTSSGNSSVTEWRSMREWLEYSGAWILLTILGMLPRSLARPIAGAITGFLLLCRPALRRTAMANLHLAFPDWSDGQRKEAIRGMVRQFGLMAVEFARFPKLTTKNIKDLVLREGFENFDFARRRGKGVLFLTGHLSAWELAPFAQALYGDPLYFLARAIDNPRVDAMVNRYRCLSGNQPIEKNNAARAMLTVLHQGGTVGILADQNTSVEEGIFVDFFGIPAATTTGIARIARRTGAAVVPGFIFWDESIRKYRLRFEPEISLERTGDENSDIRVNTKRFNNVIEKYVRAHPDQWLWVHKRWKNRPPGEPSLYPR